MLPPSLAAPSPIPLLPITLRPSLSHPLSPLTGVDFSCRRQPQFPFCPSHSVPVSPIPCRPHRREHAVGIVDACRGSEAPCRGVEAWNPGCTQGLVGGHDLGPACRRKQKRNAWGVRNQVVCVGEHDLSPEGETAEAQCIGCRPSSELCCLGGRDPRPSYLVNGPRMDAEEGM